MSADPSRALETATLAHGLGARTDLPVPVEIAMLAGGFAVFVSFAVLLALWTKPRLLGETAGRPLPAAIATGVDSAALRSVLKVAGLLAFAAFLGVAWLGPAGADLNPAPTWFYVWFWVGLVPVSVLFGPVYRIANPLRTAATALHQVIPRVSADPARILDRLRYTPAIVGLIAFLWLELVSPERADAQVVATFVTLYAVIHIAAGAWFGPRWFDQGDGFEVYFCLLARMAPIGRRSDGQLVLRNPLDGLLVGPKGRGLTTLILVLLGSTAFDGVTRQGFWKDLDEAAKATEWSTVASTILGTLGLVATIAIIGGFYAASVWASQRFLRPNLSGDPYGLYVHSLIPIMIGYTVAHYFSFALFQGQVGYLLLLDNGQVNYTFIPTVAIAIVQVAAIVVGHILAIISAHDRAIGVLRPGFEKIGQMPALSLMISYTMVGILLVANV